MAQPITIHSATDALISCSRCFKAGRQKEGARRREEKKTVNTPNASNAYAMSMVLIAFLASKPAHHLLRLRFSTDHSKTFFCTSQA